jgi:hypothetical protein
MLDLLPEHQAIHLPTHEPEYRDWKPLQVSVTPQEYWTFIDGIIHRLIEDADTSAERWCNIIEKLSHLPPPRRQQVRRALSRLIDEEAFTSDAKVSIWEALRNLVAKHREFAEAGWSLPAEELNAIDSITESLAPVDAALRHAWLFNDWLPELQNLVEWGDIR